MDDLISRKTLLDCMPKDDQLMSLYVRRCICDAPAVDAEPVRHGKWVFDKNANDWGIGGYVCSECQAKNNNLPCIKVPDPLMFDGTKYCPNCGAKMQEE